MYDERLSSKQAYALKKRMKREGFTKLYGMSFEKSFNVGNGNRTRALWSYETPIADYHCWCRQMVIDLHAFRCSNTTIRHFTEWLKILGFEGCYDAIKKAAIEEERAQSKMYIPEETGEWYEVGKGLVVTFW